MVRCWLRWAYYGRNKARIFNGAIDSANLKKFTIDKIRCINCVLGLRLGLSAPSTGRKMTLKLLLPKIHVAKVPGFKKQIK
jgi:hypothetical protein